MKLMLLATFLLIISRALAISNEQDFNSKQPHELNGSLDGNGNIEVSTRLNHRVAMMESNEHKHELSVTIRKGGGIGRGVGAGAGAGIIGAGVIGGSTAYHGSHRSNSSAPSLSAGPYVCVSTFLLCLSFWL
ncbi:putative GRP family [Medicago truncatula]|uniref:GRP family n=1 Tax=Medicago truncatula TaxID=3880 RepID=A0A072UFN5_MEDTR|nr:putative GRP family [Medicago truncatula]